MGDKDLSLKICEALEENGIESRIDEGRGLDHGAWVPLKLIFPEADMPIFQISICPHMTPEQHYRLGKALKPFRKEGIMILASGSITHRLQGVWNKKIDDRAEDFAVSFRDYVFESLSAHQGQRLFAYEQHPTGKINHPSPDHFLPLFVAMGAGGEETSDNYQATRLHQSFTYSHLAMDAYQF